MTSSICVTLDFQTIAEIQKIAVEREFSVSKVVRTLLKQALKSQKTERLRSKDDNKS